MPKLSTSEKYILLMLANVGGSKKAAAQRSGVSLRRVQQIVKKHGGNVVKYQSEISFAGTLHRC